METVLRPPRRYKRSNIAKIVRLILGILVIILIGWRHLS